MTGPLQRADAILCINMVHISPWAATLGLLRGAARLLPSGGPLYLYGPYVQPGVETARAISLSTSRCARAITPGACATSPMSRRRRWRRGSGWR